MLLPPLERAGGFPYDPAPREGPAVQAGILGVASPSLMRDESSQSVNAAGLRAGLVVSQYHEGITRALAEGAREAFVEAGGDPAHICELAAPGAYELPQIASALARSGRVDFVVALGCVIHGETKHFEYICQAVAQGLMTVSLETGMPVAFGVLTCDTTAQAKARAGGELGNKGVEAMHAALGAVHACRAARSAAEARSA